MESRWESARNLLHDRPHLLPPWPKHRGPAGALVADQVEVGVPLVASSVLDDGQGVEGDTDRNSFGARCWPAVARGCRARGTSVWRTAR